MEQQHSNSNKKPVSRLNLMILSLVASITLWVIIVQTVNPDVSFTISDVQVKILGEGTLRDRGIVVMNKDEIPKFSVKISGKRNDVLSAIDKVRINFDVSQMMRLGEFAVSPSVYAPQSINVEQQTLSDMLFRFEECISREIPIASKYTGLSKNKVIEIIPDAKTVTVSGAVSEMSALSRCMITVDASDIGDEGAGVYKVVYSDENGTALTSQKTLFSNVTEIQAQCKIYDKVEFPYDIDVSPDIKNKYRIDIDKDSISNEYIEGGLRDGSDEIPTLKFTIPNDDYQNGRQEFTAEVEEHEGIFITQKTLKVYGNATKLKNKKMKVSIEAVNKPEDMNVDFESIITMDITMPEDLNIDSLTGYIDLSGKLPGEYTMPIVFENPDIYAKESNTKVKLQYISQP